MELPEDLDLAETNLAGHLTFPKPADDFEPLHASDAELHRYGLPHRPDPERFPAAARTWQQAMRRVAKFTTPELEVLPDLFHGGVTIVDDGRGTLPSWCGLISPSSSWWTSWGAWMIPSVAVPPGGGGQYRCALWVGQEEGVSLLQAGTEGEVSSGLFGGPSYYAWYEWFPSPSVKVSNLSVAAGQTIIVTVGVVDTGQPLSEGAVDGPGQVSMFNMSTGEVITPIVLAPPTTNVNGQPIEPPLAGVPTATANWILERPAERKNGQLELSQLADFGAATMNGGALIKEAAALTVGEDDQGTLVNMEAPNGSFLAVAVEEPELRMLSGWA